MPSQLRPDQIEDAIVVLLQAQFNGVNVDGLSAKDLDEDDGLVTPMPAMRVYWNGEEADPARDNQRQTYQVKSQFAVICAAADLTSNEAQKVATLALVAQVRNLLAGYRLTLADASKTEPLTYRGTRVWGITNAGAWFQVLVDVPGIAQFTSSMS